MCFTVLPREGESVRNKSILLVGGTGYIGLELYRQWNPGNTICYTGRRSPSHVTPEELEDYRYLDLGVKESIHQVLRERVYDYIICLAARVQIDMQSSPTTLSKGDVLYDCNVEGLKSFMEIAKETPSRIIYFSSMTVYDKNNPSPVKEDSFLFPFHTYGQSKMLGEKKFAESLESSTASGAILRIPGIFGGKRQGGYIHHIVQKLRSEEPVFLDVGGVVYWETLYIYDLISMLEEWMECYPWGDSSCEIFNLCYGQETDFVGTAHSLKKLLGSTSTISLSEAPSYGVFYMDNTKVRQYWSPLQTYDYRAALRRYIHDSLV